MLKLMLFPKPTIILQSKVIKKRAETELVEALLKIFIINRGFLDDGDQMGSLNIEDCISGKTFRMNHQDSPDLPSQIF